MMQRKLNDDQILTPTGKLITFNDEQYQSIKKIRKWVNTDNKIFTLAGFSGTGKSTVIKKIIDEFNGQIVVSAPTHKAKKVIMRTTGEDGQTLQALLGLRPDVELDSFNPNDPQFNPIAEPRIGDYDLCIIDEASMINEDLYNLIIEKINESETKVIFMGDPAQIPPINEKESVVFKTESKEFFQLTKLERQSENNPLCFVYDNLRNNLLDEDGGFERITKMNKQGEGVIFTNDKNIFRELLMEKIKSNDFENNWDYVKVIAWRNVTVMSSNKIIRDELFGKNADIVETGDVLMAYRSVRAKNGRYNIIDNSVDYKVISKSEIMENKYGILGYMIKIREDMPRRKSKNKEIFVIDIKDHNNLHKYAEIHDELKKKGKEKKEIDSWKDYYEFRRNNILMTTITKFKNGFDRSKYDKIVKDIDYGFAITGHRSQGSTYTHSFILENDIDLNRKIKEKNQILYVALTRPTTSAVVLTDKIS